MQVCRYIIANALEIDTPEQTTAKDDLPQTLTSSAKTSDLLFGRPDRKSRVGLLVLPVDIAPASGIAVLRAPFATHNTSVHRYPAQTVETLGPSFLA